MKVGPEQTIQMPMRTVVSLIALVALGTFGFFQIQEKLNQHATQLEIMEKDLIMNTDFRIKWPRGLLGSLPADSKQFMLIDELYKQLEKLQSAQEQGLHHSVNIERLQVDVDKILRDIEKLKDASRELKFGQDNGGP
tara:strand:+ start:126 stop:536 length:411 start_codon:yes stop_codon:yes gene_type:complete